MSTIFKIPKGWKLVQPRRSRVNPFPGDHYEKQGFKIKKAHFGPEWTVETPEGKYVRFQTMGSAFCAVDDFLNRNKI